MRNISITNNAIFTGHTHPAWGLTSIKNKNIAISGSLDGMAMLWSLNTNQLIRTIQLPTHNDPIYSICWLNQIEKLLIGRKDGSVDVFKYTDSVSDELVATTKQHTATVYSFLEANEQQFISHAGDQTFKLWDLETLSSIHTFQNASEYVSTLASLPNTSYFFSENNNYQLGIWDYRAFNCVQTFAGHGYKIRMRALTMLPKENEYLLATGGTDYHIKLWDLRTYQCVNTLIGHSNYVNALTPLREYELASASGDRSIKIWNTQNGACHHTTANAHRDWIQALHYYSDDHTELLLSGSGDNTVGVWEIEMNQFMQDSVHTLGIKNTFALLPSIAFNDLTLQRELGKGGFGVVYEALWRRATKVAVKKLSSHNLPQDVLKEFKREAEIHGALRHPNIVSLYGVCLEEANYALIMEYMLNGSLFNILHNATVLSWSQRINIALQITSGLSFLHAHQILHRDLKSLNVLLDSHMQAKLSDFGLSKIKTNTATTTAQPAGTVSWMAPELFEISGECNQSTDIYSLGIVFWELATRKIPYEKAQGNQALVINWVSNGKRESIPSDTPLKLSQLISRCWAQRAEDRPASEEILKDLVEEKNNIEQPPLLASQKDALTSGYQLKS